MTIIKLNIDDENELTNNEYDVVNNALRRKAEKLGLLKEYRTLPIEWEIKVTIGDTK